MKINLHSITFKTVSKILIFSALFIVFISITLKNIFSSAYMDVEKEKIAIIENNMLPSLSINLSYGFDEAINEIANKTLVNKNVLLLEIVNYEDHSIKTFTKNKRNIEDYKNNMEFFSYADLTDPVTKKKIGKSLLVYSNESYKNYMYTFNKWFYSGVILFALSILLLAYSLYKSLRNLNILDMSLKNFNPDLPQKLELITSTKDEVDSISNSANTMIENIINFLQASKELNTRLTQSQSHLKNAQRMAKVGSLEYNVNEKKLILSDEYYRIFGENLNSHISLNDFLNFISKDDYIRVKQSIESALKNGSYFDLKYTVIRKDLKKIYIQTKGKVRKKQDSSTILTAVSMDITADVENKKTIEKLAYYDSLTGLANRTLLKDRMHKAIQIAKRKNEKLAVVFLDLDHFKLVNDTLGHTVGDELLIYIANLIKNQIRESDTLSRIGGDEFIILLPFIKNQSDLNDIVSKIQNALQNKHEIGIHQLYTTSSIGISMYPEHGEDCDTLIRNADTAMYEAKNDGRNKYITYNESMGNFIDNQLHLEQDLTEAVKNKTQIEVFYQAKIDALTKSISGAEALVRWRHPTKGLIFPDEFIFMAESTGLMIELGNNIIEESIKQLKGFNQLKDINLKMAINLSARQFQDSSLVPFISSMLEKHQVIPQQVEFEITESISMSNHENTLKILNELRTIGVSIAIDDFGTGHSSLAYLKKFPLNTLKIDKSFVLGIIENEEDKVIAQTIIHMAHSLGLKTVAEGVETKEHADMLHEMGCDVLQGYYYSKAITKNQFIELLKK